MCEYFDMTTCPEGGFTADADIQCYKVTRYSVKRGCACSPIFSSETWSSGETRTSCIYVAQKGVNEGFVFNGYWAVFRGKDLNDGSMDYLDPIHDVRRNGDIGLIEDGLYSYSGYMNGGMGKFLSEIGKDGIGDSYWMVFRCAIPRGSRYYVSDSAEVFVSDTLRVDGLANVYTGRSSLRGFPQGFMLGVEAGVRETGRARDMFLKRTADMKHKRAAFRWK